VATNTTTALGKLPKPTLMGQQPNPLLLATGRYGLNQESNSMEKMGYGLTAMEYGLDTSNNNQIEGSDQTCNN
jgi:hypothetical protein